jgi:serine/threonine protein kinase
MSDPVIGREIGSYQIVAVLGQGGMGRVYKAQHPYIGKQVAVKFLKAELSSKPDSVQRFFQEARSVNDIHHENVIDVLDFGKTSEGDYFILMELLQGKTLGDAIKSEAPFSAKRIGHIGLQLCSALYAAHDKSIIHRDLKPDNIFLIQRAGQKDFVKVLDFGLAKLLDDSSSNHTTTGMVMGTPLYMAPEQALGRPLDAQTDVYALGVILYQIATGTVPFYDANPVALATMHVTAKVPRPSERFASIDPKLEKIILTCLEKEKGLRYTNMASVAMDLAEACDLDTTPYFGVELNTKEEPFSEEGDGVPTSIDAERTQIIVSPINADPRSDELSAIPIEHLINSTNLDPSVNDISHLHAEVTGNQSTKSNKGFIVGISFLLMLGCGVVLAFYSDSSRNKQSNAAKQMEALISLPVAPVSKPTTLRSISVDVAPQMIPAKESKNSKTNKKELKKEPKNNPKNQLLPGKGEDVLTLDPIKRP